ncbi:hypothetical protein CBS115989_5662 [Aspergillus niger]|uniref:Contig An13c0080, genomic contig n=3 Tax=Aspergillus niger TaxID=5061 RepID=A2R1W8_ASPNC|nr:uncharacterized protein An13g02710 [Aspergillus niger]XP_025458060.1 uncharacterized protein BO96DRAFT_359508 [Aspergillus niger CBS 101883]RDH24347.1 hypothetical protein M747DRAFT_253368 [Aspergillus niger ATCC 13496]KAI2817926.1 hypothetical protein CBS115989_5662 [Aspergillus niger]KAI2831667.1 hypothetical protein CBS133816_2259 [Aspergillus niger]KAI2853435.1 hypothetical protein CBS11350_173 [Aspergillus niger]KAI2861422.1 hypothetical protein CBS11232_1058 [Aspergillus niger]|eukprot:XP_001396407.1 hypothetical protein ANI_1_358114 [Aspergillus niger CBS 513.88]
MAAPPNVRTHTKIAGTPDYDDPTFWDTKFATGRDVGEWLNSGEMLIDAVVSHLESRSATNPRVLHLGPGISKLGIKLCDEFMKRNWAGNGIVNVDFSAEAVRLGQETESNRDPSHAMGWVQANLRSWADVSRLASFSPFDVVLDKSTSDAIATSTPVTFPSPADASSTCPMVQEIVDKHGAIELSPVELLALHLAPLVQKGALWVTLSYSTMRFDNLSHMAQHWTVVSRTPFKAPQGETSSFAYAPEVFHWMYILQRK